MVPTGFRRRAVSAGLGILFVTCLVVVSGLVDTASASAPAARVDATFHLSPAGSATIITKQFPGTLNVQLETSSGTRALVWLEESDGTYALDLFNPVTDHSSIVQRLSIASGLFPVAISPAGKGFVEYLWNNSEGSGVFATVSLSGRVAPLDVPLSLTYSWLMPFGNATSLFLSSPGVLYEINPTTWTVARNYSPSLTRNLFVHALTVVGDSVYLAGSESLDGSTSGYFGSLNSGTGLLQPLYHPHFYPAPWGAAFYAVADVGGAIYVGGTIYYYNGSDPEFDYHTTGGTFFRYVPSTGELLNRTFQLPQGNESVWTIEPWKGSAVVNIEAFAFHGLSQQWIGGSMYFLGPGGRSLTNEPGFLPAGFVVDVNDELSESGGYLFMGGMNASTGLAELVAVPV